MLSEIPHGKLLAKRFLNDDRGAMNSNSMLSAVVAVAVGGILVAYLVPLAIDEMASTSTSSWGDGASGLFDILPLLVVLAAFLFFIGAGMAAKGGL